LKSESNCLETKGKKASVGSAGLKVTAIEALKESGDDCESSSSSSSSSEASSHGMKSMLKRKSAHMGKDCASNDQWKVNAWRQLELLFEETDTVLSACSKKPRSRAEPDLSSLERKRKSSPSPSKGHTKKQKPTAFEVRKATASNTGTNSRTTQVRRQVGSEDDGNDS
jgi:hypothetical protein